MIRSTTRTRRILAASALTACVGSGLALAPTPAHALVALEGQFDEATFTMTEPVNRPVSKTINVLDNDVVDPSLTATVTSLSNTTSSNADTDGPYALTWDPDGDVTVTWTPDHTEREDLDVTFNYTVTDSAGQYSLVNGNDITMSVTDPDYWHSDGTALTTADDTFGTAENPVYLNREEDDYAVVSDYNNRLDGWQGVTGRDDDAVSAVYGATAIASNDTWPLLVNDYTDGTKTDTAFDIVSQPSSGTVVKSGESSKQGVGALMFVPAAQPATDYHLGYTDTNYTPAKSVWVTDPQTVSFTYRLCRSTSPQRCSAPATVTITYALEGLPDPVSKAHTYAFYEGGPTSTSATISDLATKAGYTADDLTGLTPWVTTDSEDGDSDPVEMAMSDTLTITAPVDSSLTYPSYSSSEPYSVEFKNADGAVVATLGVYAHYSAAPAAPTTSRSDGWVNVNDANQVAVSIDDEIADDNYGGGEWVGAVLDASQMSYGRAVIVKTPTRGHLTKGYSTNRLGVGDWLIDDGDLNVVYQDDSGERGEDSFVVDICAAYPVDICTRKTVYVHTTPEVDARPDTKTLRSGTASVVKVLSNDVYTDINLDVPRTPAPEKASVTLGKVPAGLHASVTRNRAVRVSGKPGTYRVGYTLRDWTGTSKSTITVKVRSNAAPVTGPTARDDHAAGRTGKPIKVSVLKNDHYTGKAKVTLLGATKGVRARVVGGKVLVTVPHRLGGDADEVVRYRLTDATGKSDTARVTVLTLAYSVTGGALKPTLPKTAKTVGAPAATQADHSDLGWVAAAGGGVLALGGVLLVRRRRRAL
ncbi:hypothetical protein [Nocardioides sp. KR10-350]|uniref:hypothetical protein n=1 Tax=Nocardioides cheoyonin TaxID=3156615 RepID=UPI0032B483ED